MKPSYRVGVIGGRGHTGRELLRLLSERPSFEIGPVTSREYAGRAVRDVFGIETDSVFENLSAEDVAAAEHCDAYVLGLPNGLSQPYVEAIDAVRPGSVIVDLSTDHRHEPGWVYGLTELNAEATRGALRIANPGCYATAAILALWPLRHLLEGTASAFGVSGYSGAGTTPSPRNDPAELADNIMPYGLAAHAHEAEIARAVGHEVRFAPHVAQFFRGLMVTVMAPLSEEMGGDAVRELFAEAYRDSGVVQLHEEAPTLREAANTPNALIGGFAVGAGRVVTIVSVLDNLLKGAASQALANLELALGVSDD
jgi:N-acetyl-gamma-glutamyl-phosphate reductase common form